VDDGEFLHILSQAVISDWGGEEDVIGMIVYLLREESRISDLMQFLWPVGSDNGDYYRNVLCHKMLFYIGFYDLSPILFPFYSAYATGVWRFAWCSEIVKDGILHENIVEKGHLIYDHEKWVIAGNPAFPPVQTTAVLIDEADEEVSTFLKNHYNLDLIIPYEIQAKMDLLLDLVSTHPEHDDVVSYTARFSALVRNFVADMKKSKMDEELALFEADWEADILRYAEMKKSKYSTYDLKIIGGDRRLKLMLALSAIAPSMRGVRLVDCVFFLRIMGGILGKNFVQSDDYVYYPCEKYGAIVEVTADRAVVPRRRYLRACEQMCAINVAVLVAPSGELCEELMEMVQDLVEIMPVVIYSETDMYFEASSVAMAMRKRIEGRFKMDSAYPPPWAGVRIDDRQSLCDAYYYYYREWKRHRSPSSFFYRRREPDDSQAKEQVLSAISAVTGPVNVSSEIVVSNGGVSFYQRKVETRFGSYMQIAKTSSRLTALIQQSFAPTTDVQWHGQQQQQESGD